jgi:hypothetical protein
MVSCLEYCLHGVIAVSWADSLQKFKFCGDLDAPDWLLKEISVIAKIVRKNFSTA